MKTGLRKLAGIAPLFALALAGCDVMGYEDDIGGYYSYAGTVEDEPGYSVNGDIYISQQYSSGRADADIEWHMYEGSRMILDIEAYDVPVYVSADGRVSFDVVGDLELSSGRWEQFTLRHEGRVSGRTMRGEWDLETDISRDQGRFTASR